MHILIVNPPHDSIGSRVPDDQLPPLGLLSIGGPLIDAGHDVELLDADIDPMSIPEISAHVAAASPDAVFIGHSGSTSAHPVVAELAGAVRRARPGVRVVYGGVFPTFHWREILNSVPAIDVIVRGEGERTAVHVARALERGSSLEHVEGIAYRRGGEAIATRDAPLIEDLDEHRVGWELIDHRRYSYWGGKRAVVVQFSRGCPHGCSYCGQRIFWRRWRHRDPRRLASDLARMHREHGVEVVNFADETPTVSRRAWKAFLEALIEERVPLGLVASTRADHIVRDADILHLYRKAGFERFLLGIESYAETTRRKIAKGGSMADDRRAIELLREHGILSMATYVVGFEEEKVEDYVASLRRLVDYDPDQIQLLYVTPHAWTPFFDTVAGKRIVQADQRMWDYKHQVLETAHLSPWQVLCCVKLLEAAMQLRPRSLLRCLAHPDPSLRHAMRWYYRMGRRVWIREIWSFLARERHETEGPSLARLWRLESRPHPVERKLRLVLARQARAMMLDSPA
jgi:anaerobic magnesium-protoporphyrin IX monomethyl ester cyclase